MSFSAILLAAAFLSQGQAPSPAPAPDPTDDPAHVFFTSERFQQLRQEGSAWCGWSRLPNECRAAFLAASYSGTNVLICRERASEPFAEGRQGGVATTFAQVSIERTCRAEIHMCRENWRHFFGVSGRDEKPALTQRREEILNQNLNNLCGEERS